MPLHHDTKVVFSKRIKTPSGMETLGLFGTKGKSRKLKLVDTRACRCPQKGKCECPSDPKEKLKLMKKLKI